MPPEANPPISTLLRAVTGVELFVLASIGVVLFFFPETARDGWPWPLTPFSTRFLGAVYLSSVIPILVLFLIPRWSPAREVLPPLLAFTVIVLAVSLLNTERFDFDRFSTWVWFTLYILLPVNTAWHLYLYRSWGRANAADLSAGARWTALTAAAVLGVYGVALLVAPDTATSFWPWPIDAFHARMYSAPFISGAIGLVILLPRAARLEVVGAGATQAALGILAVAGMLIVDRSLQRVDYSDTGTWVWIGLFAFVTVSGALLAITGRAMEARA